MREWLESIMIWSGSLLGNVLSFMADFVEHDYRVELVYDAVVEHQDEALLAPVIADR